jgi:hypothetical protein
VRELIIWLPCEKVPTLARSKVCQDDAGSIVFV